MTYQCAPDVKWVVETYGILIVHPERGAYCSLPYPAAAVWDLVSRGHRLPKIAQMLRHIGRFQTTTDAERYAVECLETWTNAGLVQRTKGGGENV